MPLLLSGTTVKDQQRLLLDGINRSSTYVLLLNPPAGVTFSIRRLAHVQQFYLNYPTPGAQMSISFQSVWNRWTYLPVDQLFPATQVRMFALWKVEGWGFELWG